MPQQSLMGHFVIGGDPVLVYIIHNRILHPVGFLRQDPAAVIFHHVMGACPEEPGESIDPNYRRFAPGLGLTKANICPHYQKVKNYMLDGKRLFEDITYGDSMGKTFFALPDGSYFYQDEDGLLLCGKAYRIKNGILELLTKDGETLNMEVLQ